MKLLTSFILALSAGTLLAGDIVIYPNGIVTGTGPNCIGGSYAGYAVYARTLSNGWGWAPDTNGNTVFTATYTNNVTLNLQSAGKNGDVICSTSNSLQIANPPFSTKYRFTIFFHNASQIPTSTNQCGLVLHNFLP